MALVAPAGALALLGLLALVVGLVLRFVLPGAEVPVWGLVGLGTVLVGGAAAAERRRLRTAMSSRRGLLGLGTTVSVALVTGIVVLANAISLGVFHRIDATGVSQFTLTAQTREVLAGLRQPVEAISFFSPGMASPLKTYADSLLAEYQVHSGALTVRAVDPEISPDQARRYGVEGPSAVLGAVVFTGPAGQRRVMGPQVLAEAEHAFTSAILEVTGVRQKTVYVVTGHGERDLESDFAQVRSALRDHLYRVAPLDLLQAGGVPEDAAAVILAGPRNPLASDELGWLGDHLEDGGRLLVLVDPDPDQGLRRLLSDQGLEIEDGRIIDPDSHVVPNRDNLLVPRNRNQFGLAEVYFPGSTALIPRPGAEDAAAVTAVAWSSPESWLEQDAESAGDATFDADRERPGSFAVAAFIERQAIGSRLAVIGDSDFAADRHFQNGGNADLFIGAVNWLAAGREVVAIERKVLPMRRLLLTPEEARFLHISSIALMPSLVLVAGAVVWWRRRAM